MKKIAIVAPYFPPSNLAGVHRNRFLAAHLKKFGWEPTVLTVKPEYYKEPLDPGLERLIPKEVKIVKTKAFRPNILIGDAGIRSFFWHWAELRKLARKKELDLVFISLFPAVPTLLGRFIYEEFKIPYVIDYQDPWIPYKEKKHNFFSKLSLAYELARFLEPIAIKKVSLITSVAEPYYQGVIARNPGLKTVEKAVLPLGFEPGDFDTVSESHKEAYLFKRREGRFKFVYAGAMLPQAHSVLRAFLKSLKSLEATNKGLFDKIEVYFIGTGKSSSGACGFNIKPIAEELGLYGTSVIEHPDRIPYLDVLAHLNAADSILVIGSTEKHYTPSKIFQAVFAKKPILALLHKESTAVKFLNESKAAGAVTFTENTDPDGLVPEICKKINEIMTAPFDAARADYHYFDQFTAESIAGQLARTLDRIVS